MSNKNLDKLIDGMTAAYLFGKILLDDSGIPDDFIILDINKSFGRIFGLKKENIINKKISEVLPDIRSIAPEIIQNCGESAISGKNIEFDQYFYEDGKWLAIHVSSQEKYFFSAIAADITEIKKIETERIEQTLQLKQRVKEMDLLVQLSQLMQKPDLSLETFLRETMNYIPAAFRYPEITIARVSFRDMHFSTSFETRKATSWILSENLIIRGELSGSIEVYYIEEKDGMDEAPFLQEELRLINTLARYVEKIIEKIEADEAVKQSRMKLQQYLDNAPDGILIIDKDARFIEVNPAACRLFGFTENEILQLSVPDILPDKYKESGISDFKTLFKKGEFSDELGLLRKDGNTITVDVSGVKLPDGIFMAFCKDISERKKAEKQLVEMASFHKTLLDTIPTPVFYKDVNGRYLGINRHYTEYFGYRETDLLGKSNKDFVPNDLAEITSKRDEDLYKNEGIQIYETRISDVKGNPHDVIFHKAVFKDSSENPGGIIGVLLDITERKRFQKDLELYFRAFQSVDQPVIITDRDGNIIEVNDAFSKIYGYSKESVKGQNPRILNPGRNIYINFGYSDEQYDELFSRLWKDITDPSIGTWEDIVINKKKDGSLFWIKLVINAAYDKDGDLQHFIGLPIDISSSMHNENMTKVQLYQTIASLSELRDNETGNHMRRVGLFTKLLARAYKKPEKYCDDIEIFSQLHDIGKVGITDSILLSPKKLNDDEIKIMKTHTILGYNIVKGIREMEMAAAITLSHHERYDGNGYPNGLRKDEIPLSARITTIADVYDSLRSKRTYKNGWSHKDAKKYIFENSGKRFDPDIVGLFADLEKNFDAVYNDLRY